MIAYNKKLKINITNNINHCNNNSKMQQFVPLYDYITDTKYEESKETKIKIYNNRSPNKLQVGNEAIMPVDKVISRMYNYTYDIIKYVPFEDGNCVYSGGSLYDVISGNEVSGVTDIDIFMFGDIDKQKVTVDKLVDELHRHYKINIVIENNVMNIYFYDIPRTLQIINSSETSPEKIIGNFDCTHVMSFYDGKKIYSSIECINALKTRTTKFYFCKKIVRLYKAIMRHLDIVYQDIQVKTNWRNISMFSSMDYHDIVKDETVIEYLKKTNELTNSKFINFPVGNMVVVNKSTVNDYFTTVKPFSSNGILLNYFDTPNNNVRGHISLLPFRTKISNKDMQLFALEKSGRQFSLLIENAKLMHPAHCVQQLTFGIHKSNKIVSILQEISKSIKMTFENEIYKDGYKQDFCYISCPTNKKFKNLVIGGIYNIEIKIMLVLADHPRRIRKEKMPMFFCRRVVSVKRCDDYIAHNALYEYFYDDIINLIMSYINNFHELNDSDNKKKVEKKDSDEHKIVDPFDFLDEDDVPDDDN